LNAGKDFMFVLLKKAWMIGFDMKKSFSSQV